MSKETKNKGKIKNTKDKKDTKDAKDAKVEKIITNTNTTSTSTPNSTTTLPSSTNTTPTTNLNPYIEEKNDSFQEIKHIPLKLKSYDYSINPNDLFLVGDSLIDTKGLISHHLESANQFYKNGLNHIITQGFKIQKDIINKRSITPEDKEIERINCEVIPTSVKLTPPNTSSYKTGRDMMIYPKNANIGNKNYCGDLYISCDIKAIAYKLDGSTIERKESIGDFRICKIPIIKGSIMCNTYGKSAEALRALGEDPSDPGGYFVVKGEWAVDCIENMIFNQPKIYINEGYGKSRVRCEFISKPGDGYQNSDYFIIRLFNDDRITIEIVRDKGVNKEFPFYMLFRALGWTNDQDLFDYVVFDVESKVNESISNILLKAMYAKYSNDVNHLLVHDQQETLRNMVDIMGVDDAFKYLKLKTEPENYQYAIRDVLKLLDINFLPHIGMTENHRIEKLKFLALMIRKVIMVYLRYIPPTDRDSYRNKRITAAGDNYAKVFKTYFNQTVVMQIKRRMNKDFTNTPFSQVNLVNLVKQAVQSDDFERLIVQTIVSGNKATLKMKRRTITNRLATQLLDRKNQLKIYATMRQVSASSADSAKASERASEMRRVHMSALGYICVNHSPPEGEKVGINKQMAIFATIAPTSSSEVLRDIILKDPELIQEKTLTPMEIFRGHYACVYVNGYLLGYIKNSIAFVNKYRRMRRQLELNPHTTIYWDNVQNEVQFFVDMGRITRPLIIVYNNQRDAEYFANSGNTGKKFEQGIALTNADITALYKKEKTIDDLLREQKIEYITPEEQENTYVCCNFTQLTADRYNELNSYTHCDIPQAMLGITALTAPYGNHNQAPRVTYQTSQAKQTCGYYCLNWAYRMDKETFLQYICEEPLVRTVSNKYLFPNGNNIMVAIAAYTGGNQEDSLILSQSAIDRGFFDGSKINNITSEFDQKEKLANPDASKTEGIKTANYEKLVNGVVQPGMIIEEKDVVIGKIMETAKNKGDKYIYTDRSVVYNETEPAIVHSVLSEKTDAGEEFTKVSLRLVRKTQVGDKFSSRSGQKGIVASILRESDLPYTEEGLKPTLIFGPHGMPSRMTIAQLIESLLGILCAHKGAHHDGTMFKPIDIESIGEELEQYGFNRYGYWRMISGITGEFIDSMVFMGPTFYQRLQKFVNDAEYSVKNAMTDALTLQPNDGAGANGGLRLGEMERDVICSHGASRFLYEKFFNHSDGYVEYICRCGKPAIVNHRHGLYKCKYCGENADIVAVPTSWTAKLFKQEMESINIGIREMMKPFTYPKYDTKDRELTEIDKYNKDSVLSLIRLSQETIDDAGTVEAE